MPRPSRPSCGARSRPTGPPTGGRRPSSRWTAALYAMSRELASTRGVDELLKIAVRHIGEVFRSPVVVLLPGADGTLAAWSGSQFAVDTNELGVGRWVYEHRQSAGLGTTTLP